MLSDLITKHSYFKPGKYKKLKTNSSVRRVNRLKSTKYNSSFATMKSNCTGILTGIKF